MNRDLIFLAKTPFLLATLVLLTACSKPQPEPPNILFFFVDDMGWQETSVSFHTKATELNQRYHTPHMETLASEGIKFTQAYAYAVCSPSRVSIMTGMNAMQHQVTNWTLRKDVSPDTEDPNIEPAVWNVNGLSDTVGVDRTIVVEQTLPKLLKQSGYKTIHVGKAHFGAVDTPGENPLNLGFDINIAGHAAGGPGSYYGDKNFSAVWRDGSAIWDVPGLEKYHGQKINLTEALTREAAAAMEQAVEEEQPFYLYLSHYTVHAPWEEDRRFYQKYLDQGLDEFSAMRASMLESMDKSLGDMLNKIKELGIEDNTLVIFMSDNGAPKQVALNKPLRGHKLTPYEGGVRVPMIVKWPGITERGSVNDQYLMIDDIFPTLMDVAGIAEEQYAEQVDGVSLVPLFRGENVPAMEERPIYWHFPHTYDQYPYSSVRKGKWKLIYLHTNHRLELYDLSQDIGEAQNVAKDHPELTRELARLLTARLQESGAGMPVDKRTGQAVAYPDEVLKALFATR